MGILKNLLTNELIITDVPPLHINGIWEGGNTRILDISKSLYIVVVDYPTITPIQFKLLFTPTERVAISALRVTDPIIEDAFQLLEDPRLTEVNLSLTSTQNSLEYLVYVNILTSARKLEILSGVPS